MKSGLDSPACALWFRAGSIEFFNCLPLFAVSAAVITSASANVSIDWVTVGNAGNAADPNVEDPDTEDRYGAVDYEYRIGKYEVTNAQYTVFLNAAAMTDSYGLYNSDMQFAGITRSGISGGYTYSVDSFWENRPVSRVSWFDAARFTNWLHNGQGSGSTETGAYSLNGATSGIINKNPEATVWIPSENEWHKAAYYNGTTSTYSIYPNGQEEITPEDANYGDSIGYPTNVGSYSNDPSFYGTFDQGGNVWEWNDAVISDSMRGLRGGSYDSNSPGLLSWYRHISADPSYELFNYGFRLASSSIAAVPEPSGMVLSLLLISGCVCRRQR